METETKVCAKCGLDKGLDQFRLHDPSKPGSHRNTCKKCQNRMMADARKKARLAAGLSGNRPKKKKRTREQERERYLRKKNDPAFKKRRCEYYMRYLRSEPWRLLAFRMRNNVRMSLKRSCVKRKTPTLETLGLDTWDELRHHLESQFLPGMTWDNCGRGGWHIDHIQPIAQFDFEDQEQVKICFWYTNLQPLWEFDNLSKGGGFGSAGR